MVKIDLITGFLGSGKTTFIKKYARFFMDQGQRIGILENDYGAVNVDMLLLNELRGANCELEMVAGGCDADCHRRRFKTKLISMGMCGYNRVLVEPSGIFDLDEFFDALHEEPLDAWYEIGNVIGIVDANLASDLSEASDYLLASELSSAGVVIFSKVQEAEKAKLEATKAHIGKALKQVKCGRVFEEEKDFLIKNWEDLTKEDFERISNVGYKAASYEKKHYEADEAYSSEYFMNCVLTKEELEKTAREVLNDKAYGNIHRIKGFIRLPDGNYQELNATREQFEYKNVKVGQEVIIVIGEKINRERLVEKFKTN